MKRFALLITALTFFSLSQAQFYTQSTCTFEPLATAGTTLCLGDDVMSAAVPIGFTFDFYGTDFTNCYISSNGFITFTAGLGSGCCSGQILPNATYTNSVFFAWEDLDPNSCIDGDITYYTTGAVGSRIFVMSYVNVPHYPGPEGVFPVTAQIQLFETTNEIKIVTTAMNSDGGLHTMGLNHNSVEADVVAGRNSANWSVSNECISFAPFVALANDIGVIDITSPTSGPDLAFEDVIITIENFGSSDASGFVVNYQVDGGIVTGGFFPGTLPALSTASFTAPEGWDFSVEGCYEITAWTDYDSDENAANDSYTETVCHTGAVTGTGAMYIYSNTTGGEPWFSTTNTTAMNTTFGAEGVGWTRAFFETVDVAAAFSPDNCFVFLEGSDGQANELETFLTANLATIEGWVSSGGKLLLNSAPNEGDGMSFGFGGTTLVYAYYTGTAGAVDPGHPIFTGPNTPVGTSWTGSSFGHARITGTGLTNLINDVFAVSNIVLAEKAFGAGRVVFGGMTTNNFHSPLLQAANLRANILAYLACAIEECPAPTGLSADAITGTSAHLDWEPSDASGGYHLSVYTTDEVLVLKQKVLGGLTDWTVTGLTPGTDYAYHVRSICVAAGLKSVISDNYYFSTPLRIGENNDNVSVYPNPTTGVFTIALNGYANNTFELNVVNAVGQLVYATTVNVNADNFTKSVDLSNVAAGIYQVNLTNENTTLNYSISVND